MNAQSSILVGCENKTVWVRVMGKGSFQNSSGLKEFTKEMINRGSRDFVIDFKNCETMDSTFMGTLAGVALRLREMGQGHLHAVNLNERNTELLQGLGLDQLFSMDLCAVDEPKDVQTESLEPQTADQTKETMLEAHEALVKAEPENLTKFKDVLQYLKQDLHVHPSPSERHW